MLLNKSQPKKHQRKLTNMLKSVSKSKRKLGPASCRFSKLNVSYGNLQAVGGVNKLTKPNTYKTQSRKTHIIETNPIEHLKSVKRINKYDFSEQKHFRNMQIRSRQQNFNACTIKVIQKGKMSSEEQKQNNKKRQINVHVTSFGELVSYLKKGCQSIVGYKSVPQNLVIDYYLTLKQADGSFLNGSSIFLKPIYKILQPTISIQSFKIIKCVGNGGFSKVFLCKFVEDGKFYAMKVIQKQQILRRKKSQILKNQFNILKKLKGQPFIVDLKFSFETKKYVFFILQYCPGSQFFSLIKKVKRMSEKMAKFYFVEILLGLQAIHKNNILYRDFKPENILIDLEGHIRITDFGLSKPLTSQDHGKSYSFCGSPEYMPPEIVSKSGHTFAADFYSLGALLYQMLTGLPPFYSDKVQKIYDGTLNKRIGFPKNMELSQQVKNLLKGLLNKNDKQRIGCLFGVKEILAHPWFGKINKKQYLLKKVATPVNFLSPQSLEFQFEQFQQENKAIDEIIKEPNSQKCKKYGSEFYYDSRSNQGQFSIFKDIDGLQIERKILQKQKENNQRIRPLRKFALNKRQSKILQMQNRLSQKNCNNNNLTLQLFGDRSTLRL